MVSKVAGQVSYERSQQGCGSRDTGVVGQEGGAYLIHNCPICGRTPLVQTSLYRTEKAIKTGYLVVCDVDCIAQRTTSKSISEAVAKWNRRA